MSHELPKAYDPSIIEERWAEYWVRERIFDVATPDEAALSEKKPFTMLLPPPNVTGRLHIGHMLNQTEMDILTRWHRMSGDTALWVPGTDHAGIATQMMVERQLKAEGLTRQQLGREEFEARVWQWKSLYGNAILDQMKRLGSTVDWSREYFTMDDRLSVAVKEAFVRLYEQGLIYRGAYIVNWCPGCQTAVSDLEVVHEDQLGKIYEISYPLADGPLPDGTASIVIATTRPETMLGDVAVAVNPTDERYTHLIGKLLTLPLVGREIPIIADDWAKPEFGTGAVKVTPAHDPNDFAIGQRHALASINIMDETAHIALPGSTYHGLDRFEARKKIVADLEEQGLLVAVKDHQNSIGLCDRSKDIIEPRLSTQWFLAVNKAPNSGGESIAANARAAVDKGCIKFTPDQYRKTYDEWMKNIYDWCISRQLWWGHRIPAWHCAVCHKITVARETPAACAHCASRDIKQETDVLDTWFSSGLLPFTVFGWPNTVADTGIPTLSPDLAAFYPTQLLVTGFDILFFWVARMIMLGCHFMLDVPMPDGNSRTLADAVPFREVYIHALVRDADRQKMSKTKGNVVDPIEVITKFGTDAVRFTLASMASPGTDIAFSEARTEGNRAFANKIWNAARFILMQVERAKEVGIIVDIEGLPEPLDLVTGTSLVDQRWIVAKLSSTISNINKALTNYRFDFASNYAYRFFWNDFCDWFIEIAKLRLNFDEVGKKEETSAYLILLLAVFENALRMLSPFMPFITEEIWHTLYEDAPPTESIALAPYPRHDGPHLFGDAVWAVEAVLQSFVTELRGLRKSMGVPDREFVTIRFYQNPEGGSGISGELGNSPSLYMAMARISNIEYVTAPLSGDGTRSTEAFDVEVIYERQIDVPAERERLTKDLAKYEKGITAADRQLTNDAFMAKAPAHIVEGLRKQSAETRMLYDKTKAALEALPHE